MTFIKKKQSIFILCLLALVAVGIFYIGRMYLSNQKTSYTQVASAVNNFPTLVLPAKYFLNKDIIGEEVDTASPSFATASENNWPWTSASIDNGDDYQTYPTTTISFTNYSNESKLLSSVDMSGYSIGTKKTFSMEGDSSKETAEILCSVGSADGYCGEVQIVKGDTVIFHASSDYIDILPSSTGNGFYVKSENDVLEQSRANTLGYVKTRFVYDGKKFKPIYGQTVYYLNVQNSTSTGL